MTYSRCTPRGALASAFGVGVAALLAGACSGPAFTELLGAPEVDASVSSSDSGAQDGAGETSPEGATTVDAATLATVQCGQTGPTCSLPSEVCCRGTTDTCTGANACTSSGPAAPLSIPCDEAADCRALGMRQGVCCVTMDSAARAKEVRCRLDTQCIGSARVIACNPNDTSSPCPPNLVCKLSTQTMIGFYLCLMP